MLFTIAWRNIWRHPARSGVLLTAVVAGTWAGIVTAGWTNGLVGQRIEYLIRTELSHVQVDAPSFRVEREVWMTIPDGELVLGWLEENEQVRSVAPRILAGGLARSPVTTAGVQIRGIDADRERSTSAFDERLVEGTWFEDEVRNPALVGRRLSEVLRLEIGDRLVLQFQDVHNEITAAAFTIVGLYQSASSDYDERNVFVLAQDLSPLLAPETIWHEIAVSLHVMDHATDLVESVHARFDNVHAQTWFELSPEIRYMSDWVGIVTYILMAVIMLALCFGILNTMLMAIFERVRELGMLLSIGMGRARVFFMIILESLALTLTGTAIGISLSWLTLAWLSERGIDMSAFADGMAEFGFDPVVYPFVSPVEYAGIVLLVITASFLAALYPAVKAVRTHPLEASKGA